MTIVEIIRKNQRAMPESRHEANEMTVMQKEANVNDMMTVARVVGRSWWLQAGARVSKPALLCVSALLRCALVLYGMWHDDAHPELPYTDVDYAVFTRGAEHLLAGRSPYLCGA